jgi:hypothetical protein
MAEPTPDDSKIPKSAGRYEMSTPGPAKPTLSVVPVDLFVHDAGGNEVLIGRATAFCDRWAGRQYLITNWHNVTGRDPATGQPRQPDCVVPSFVRAHYIKLHATDKGAVFAPLDTFPVDIPIGNAHDTSWLMHKDGQAIDIAAVALPDDDHRYIIPMVDAVQELRPQLKIGDDLFILGFPRGLRPIGNFPIWKRASIATEPLWQANQERCFWVDSATREGMSGSPVIARALSAEDKARLIGNGPLRPNTIIVLSEPIAFVGVYSGRIGIADALEAQIGKVWNAALIQEMLVDPRPLDFEIK